jgi:hypothetical protein
MLSVNKHLKTGTIIASGILGVYGILISSFIWKMIEISNLEKNIKNLKIEYIPSLPIKRMNAGIDLIFARLSFDSVFSDFFDNLRRTFKEQILLIGKENKSVSHDMVHNILEDMFQRNQFLLPLENTNPDIDMSDLNLIYQDERNTKRKNFFVVSKGSRKYFEYALEYPNLKMAFENIIETSIPEICKSSDNVSYNIETIYQENTSDAIANIVLASNGGSEKVLVFCYDKVIINGKPYLYSDGFENIKPEIQSYKDELNLDGLSVLFVKLKELQDKFEMEINRNKVD